MQLKIKLIMSDRILVKAKLHSEQIKKKTQQPEELLAFCFKIKFYKKKKEIVNFKLMV